MGSLKNSVLRLGSFSITVGGVAIAGRIGVLLGLVLIALAFVLITVLALVGTFGADRHREAAQKVLAILLGRP
jgi:hypothetical protein